MLPKLSVHYIQFEVAWHDWDANRAVIESFLAEQQSRTDLILLPEMFASGFTMEPAAIAQEMNGPAVKWMTGIAGERQCHVMGSLVIKTEEGFYNRLICAHPDGTLSFYDKRHLFTYAKENEHYEAGSHRIVIDINGWKVCPLICYDLRFPVWSRNTLDYDVLVYVANWPSARAEAWTALLKARAIENLCYCVGLNRVGTDANGLVYPGLSEVFDMGGHSLQRSGDGPESCVVELEWAPLKEFRERYNFLADRDSFIID